jgi:hypothetical protein
VVRHAVTSHRQISGNAVTSAFTAIHPVLNRNQRRYHVKKSHVEFNDCWLSFTAGSSVFIAGGVGFYLTFCVSMELIIPR